MKTFLLILYMYSSHSGVALTTVPTEYINEAKCKEAGNIFSSKWGNVDSFVCIPSGNAP